MPRTGGNGCCFGGLGWGVPGEKHIEGANFVELRKAEVQLRRIYLPGTGVKIVSAVALFHSFGVARQGPWITRVNKSLRQKAGNFSHMATLGGIAQPSDCLLRHMLLAYWRKLLLPFWRTSKKKPSRRLSE